MQWIFFDKMSWPNFENSIFFGRVGGGGGGGIGYLIVSYLTCGNLAYVIDVST